MNLKDCTVEQLEKALKLKRLELMLEKRKANEWKEVLKITTNEPINIGEVLGKAECLGNRRSKERHYRFIWSTKGAEVKCEMRGVKGRAVGKAKCHKEDVYNIRSGMILAEIRARAEYMNLIIEDIEGRINKNGR